MDMTKLLETAIKAISNLPEERQDELARMLIAASNDETIAVSKSDLVAIDRGLADAEARRFAEPENIRALFAKHRTV
ncbi:hypothetical protein [Roseibium sp. M-1]